MSFTRMGDGLAGVIKGWAKDPEFRWSLLDRAWRSAAGDTMSERAKAESFDSGTLTVRVSDPSWIPTLRDLETDLVIAIRRRPGGDMVTHIKWVSSEPESTGRE